MQVKRPIYVQGIQKEYQTKLDIYITPPHVILLVFIVFPDKAVMFWLRGVCTSTQNTLCSQMKVLCMDMSSIGRLLESRHWNLNGSLVATSSRHIPRLRDAFRSLCVSMTKLHTIPCVSTRVTKHWT